MHFFLPHQIEGDFRAKGSDYLDKKSRQIQMKRLGRALRVFLDPGASSESQRLHRSRVCPVQRALLELWP